MGAEQEHRRAVELGPSSVDVHLWYGFHLLVTERSNEAISEFERAVELDPTLPLARAHLARALFFAGRNERALKEIQEGTEIQPDWQPYSYLLAYILLRRSLRDSAVAVLDRAGNLTPWDGYLYGIAGRRDVSQRILDSLMVQSARQAVDPLHLAVLQMGLGNREEALTLLERAYAERSVSLLLSLGLDRVFDDLRGEPRFQALRRLAGFKR